MGNSTNRRNQIVQAKHAHRAERNFVSPYGRKEREWRRAEVIVVAPPAPAEASANLAQTFPDAPAIFQPAPNDVPLQAATSVELDWEKAQLFKPLIDKGYILLRCPSRERPVWCSKHLLEQANVGAVSMQTKLLVRVDDTNPKGPTALALELAPPP